MPGKRIDQDELAELKRQLAGYQQREQARKQILPNAEAVASEEVLDAILETLPSPVFFKNRQGIYTGCNRAFCEFIGRSREQIVGHSVFQVAPAELARIYHDSDEKIMKQHGSDSYEAKVRFADGSLHDILFNKSTIGDPEGPVKGLVGIMTDISELNNFKQFLADIINSMADPVFVKDERHRFTLQNQAFCDFVGIPHDQLVGKTDFDFFPEEQARIFWEKDAEVFTSGQVNINQEELTTGSGRTRYLETKKAVFSTPAGERYLVGCIRDITSIRKAEREMQQLRDLLRSIIDSMPSILVTVDPSGAITHWNSEAEKLTGLPQSEVAGRQLAAVFPALKKDLLNISKAIETRQPQMIHKAARELAGQKWRTDITIYPLLTSGITGAVIRIDNVTEISRMEELLVQSEKMLSLGGLAAGMAHEINNPLAGILQNLQLIRTRLLQDTPPNRKAAAELGCELRLVQDYAARRDIPSMLEMIREAGQRAAAIVQNMLSFSRKGSDDLCPCNLDNIIAQAIEIARSDYSLSQNYDFRSILIDYRKDPELPPILGIANQLQQVLFNLLKNSAQAMAGWRAMKNRPKITIKTHREKSSVLLEICDNGPGMPEALRAKIFEPFFTTKEIGEGTGLGLSVAYFIIRETHKGQLSVSSEPNQGTCFQISLPISFQQGDDHS
jgi:PAS domain S-box-containing protein